MTQFFDAAEIAIECPHCKQQSQQQVGRLRGQVDVLCPRCAKSFSVDGTQLDQQLRIAQQQLDDFGMKLSKTIKLKL
jgi:transposase-like protein